MNKAPDAGNKPNRDIDDVGSLQDLRFAEIPKEFQTQEVIQEWMLLKQHAAKESLADCYQEIPPELRSNELIEWAAGNGINVIEGLDPSHPGYIDLAHICFRRNYQHIASVDSAVRRKILHKFCAENIADIHSIAKEFDWFRGELNTTCFKTCSMNIEFFLDTPQEMMSADVCEYALIGNYCVITALTLRARGKVNLLADQISAGGWPDNKYVQDTIQPTSLTDGVNRLTASAPGKEHETLYMAYIMSHPMDQVVPLMTNRRLQKLLFEMYSTEALAPYLKKSRALRGILLEESLGL
jgi:hypothetical protein